MGFREIRLRSIRPLALTAVWLAMLSENFLIKLGIFPESEVFPRTTKTAFTVRCHRSTRGALVFL